jgi:hypothetical protein
LGWSQRRAVQKTLILDCGNLRFLNDMPGATQA